MLTFITDLKIMYLNTSGCVWTIGIEASETEVFMTCIYLNWLCRSRAGDWDPINRFHPSTFCCLSQTRISMSIDICRVCFFALNDVRWEKDARCVDTGGIVDHHSLNLLYMTYACTINAKQKSINQSINHSCLY